MEKSTSFKTVLCIAFLFTLSICNIFGTSYHAGNCEPKPLIYLSEKDSVNPVEVFEQLWQIFNTNYPYFEQRGVDWSALYKVYSSKLTPESTDAELFTVLSCMLGNLNDGMINLDNGTTVFNAGTMNGVTMEDFNWRLVRDKYLNRNFKATPDSLIYYGWVDSEIAYLRIRRFPGSDAVDKYLDPIIQELIKAKGIIIEVRGNMAGSGSGVQAIAGRFADKKRLYQKANWRMGLNREFNNTTFNYVQPKGPVQFTGPVVLLQNKFSGANSEAFALAMRVLPNASSIGEATEGSMAAAYPERLINGWLVYIPYSYTTDQSDFCWDGIGVRPNLRKTNTKEDIAAGNDKVLEFAIEILNGGGNHRKEADGSQKDFRISVVSRFLELCDKGAIKDAVIEIEKMQKNNPKGVYFSFYELMQTTAALFSKNKMDVATAILELGVKSFPDDMTTMSFLAQAYELQEQNEKAKEYYSKVVEYKPYFPWERSALSKAENFMSENQ
jgi:carboxyl-terminal processing protease